MTATEARDISQANALLVSQCMAKGGREFPRAKQDWSSLPALPDRRYGLWSKPDAQANGYELPASPQSAQVSAQEDQLGNDWWAAYQRCLTELTLFPVMGVNTSPNPSPVDQGMNESFAAVLASAEFAAVRERWTACITSRGLIPSPDASVLVPTFPPPGEEQLRIAAVDVDCKESLNSVQQLADYEAQKQAAYIDRRESELTAYRAKADTVLTEARKVLATVAA